LNFPDSIGDLKSIGSGKGNDGDFALIPFPSESGENASIDWKSQIMNGIESAEFEVNCWKKACSVLKDKLAFQ